MLSARAPLSVKNEQTLSGQMNNMSLDKENTVRKALSVKQTVVHGEGASLTASCLFSVSRRV